jgi:hypothetical protein
MTLSRYSIRTTLLAGALLTAVPLASCDVKSQLLDAPDPDIINPGDVQSPEAADALRVGAFTRLRLITAGSESVWMFGGLLTDEWKSSDTFSQRNETDQRSVQLNNGNVQTMYRDIPRARTSAREALNALVKYKPTAISGIAQMYFTMAFAEMTLAENFCNGIPLSDASTGVVVYGPPLTNAEVLNQALIHADSALSLISALTDTASGNVRNEAAVTKGRILVDLNRHAEAATAVANVPTAFRFNATFSLTGGNNQIWSVATSVKRYTVGDSFDVTGTIANALPFASANDSRVPVTGSTTGASAAGIGFDNTTNLVTQKLWGRTDPTPIVSGVDARLIEAEARLKIDDYAGMTNILNALRGTAQVLGALSSSVMPNLTAPTTRDAAITLFFREKAFWQFSRGFRLNDLRRQIRQYSRTEATTFPKGAFFKNGVYGGDVNLPITTDEQNNTQFTACMDRNP